MFSNETISKINAIHTKCNELHNGRSAWGRGVYAYACELIDGLTETIRYSPEALDNEKLLRRALLNGASDWLEYSEGGCSLVFCEDIANRLCNATELKKTSNGCKRPNPHEEWLDVQARALYQAEMLILEAYRNA